MTFLRREGASPSQRAVRRVYGNAKGLKIGRVLRVVPRPHRLANTRARLSAPREGETPSLQRHSLRVGVCGVVSVLAGWASAIEGVSFDVGLGAVSVESTRFQDVKASDATELPVLYGSPARFTDGEYDTGPELRLGVGYRPFPRLRTALELGIARGVDFNGNANYSRSGDEQPSTAELSARRLLLTATWDPLSWRVGEDGRLWRLYMGGGYGVTEYRLTDFVQRFPALRQGPNGEVPLTALPSGSDREATFMLTAGVAIPLQGRWEIDLGYRYTDGGDVETDLGDIDIVRYRSDGTRRDLAIPIDRTAGEYRTHTLTATLRRR